MESSLKRSADRMMTKDPTRESNALPSTMYLVRWQFTVHGELL